MRQSSPDKNLVVELLIPSIPVSKHGTPSLACAHLLTAGHGHCRVESSDLDCDRAAINLTTPDVCGATIVIGTVLNHGEVADVRVPRWKYAIGAAYFDKG